MAWHALLISFIEHGLLLRVTMFVVKMFSHNFTYHTYPTRLYATVNQCTHRINVWYERTGYYCESPELWKERVVQNYYNHVASCVCRTRTTTLLLMVMNSSLIHRPQINAYAYMLFLEPWPTYDYQYAFTFSIKTRTVPKSSTNTWSLPLKLTSTVWVLNCWYPDITRWLGRTTSTKMVATGTFIIPLATAG